MGSILLEVSQTIDLTPKQEVALIVFAVIAILVALLFLKAGEADDAPYTEP